MIGSVTGAIVGMRILIGSSVAEATTTGVGVSMGTGVSVTFAVGALRAGKVPNVAVATARSGVAPTGLFSLFARGLLCKVQLARTKINTVPTNHFKTFSCPIKLNKK